MAYTLWQAHNSQEAELSEISALNIPDTTNTEPLIASPHFVINGTDNGTRIGTYLQFCVDGIPKMNITYEPINNIISFQALTAEPEPIFVFNGTVLASNIQV